MEIKIIDASFTYDLRHRILRPHQNLSACHYPLDFEYSSLHLGAYLEDQLVCVASFFKENHPDLSQKNQYRLRGMATDFEFQKQGIGTKLIAFAEEKLLEKKADVWWCNARISAALYYEKLGLTQLGAVFELEPIGPHKVMYREF